MGNVSVIEAIQEFFDHDPDGHGDRRSQQREAFHRPATVILPDGSRQAAFLRDISRDGIGLVHREPIEATAVQIIIEFSTGCRVQVAAEIVWCGPCQGYYASGVRLLEESPS